MLGKFTADALCRRAWRPPCSPMGRLASPFAPAPSWSLSAIVRTSRSTSRSKSPISTSRRSASSGKIVRRLEMNATSPRVELLFRRLERRLCQLLELTRTPKTRPSGTASSSSLCESRAPRSRSAACCRRLDIETGGSSTLSCPRRGTHRSSAECACSRVRAPSRSIFAYDRRGVRRCIALASSTFDGGFMDSSSFAERSVSPNAFGNQPAAGG